MNTFAKSMNVALVAILSVAGLCNGQLQCLLPPLGASAPVAAAGYEARVVSATVVSPRGMVFDSAGHLLVVSEGVGIVALTLDDQGGACVTSNSSKVVVSDKSLNHGIEIIGETLLLASNTDKVFTWNYNPRTASTTSAARTVVQGMFNTDHASRTITKSTKKVGTIVVNRGSQSNIDTLAVNKGSGHAQIRSFNLKALRPGAKPYTFAKDGYVMGWGMRNNVGIAEHPNTGGIWSVENSVDNIKRAGVQFNNQNPGEKLNYLGTVVNNKSPNQGGNFGYPYCYAAWAPKMVPNGGKLQVGQQFSIDQTKVTDKQCRTERVAPRLVFDAHMAPLDIKFHPNGQAAYISFHGSFDRLTPEGYKVSKVAFKSGSPVEPSTSKTAAIDLVTNAIPGACPAGCFRPTGIALGSKNRLFFASDATNEVFVVSRLDGKPL